MNQAATAGISGSGWKNLYRAGGAAALLAGILFRRNIAAEIGLFTTDPSPSSVGEWFVLLQNNRLLGLAYLNIFDVVNYALVGLMFLALFTALRHVNKGYMAIAAALGGMGIAVYFASNTAYSMLSLSEQYAAANTEEQRKMLLGAGQAMLALSRFSDASSNPGTAGLISLLFTAAAGMIASMVMLRDKVFNRATAYAGIVANGLDLAYCLGFVFVPAVDRQQLAVSFIPAAGLFLMIWHILVGWRLFQLGGLERQARLEPA